MLFRRDILQGNVGVVVLNLDESEWQAYGVTRSATGLTWPYGHGYDPHCQ